LFFLETLDQESGFAVRGGKTDTMKWLWMTRTAMNKGATLVVDSDEAYVRAAEAIRSADALLIGAGAGMGVDSGLPDFRGPQGFWRAYPVFHGRRFEEISNPVWFRTDPEQAWGFFGHRLNLYRSTVPHPGFEILRRWGERCSQGYFVFTSNVDGHFQRAGFAPEQLLECHGSIHYLQCVQPCSGAIWSADATTVKVDAETIRARSPLPQCPKCGGLARPNVLMFGDGNWVPDRFEEQEGRYARWLTDVDRRRLVVVEFGAGTAVPTVRWECERRAGQLIRVNPRDLAAPAGSTAIAAGALEAIQQIDSIVQGGCR
jgi:NAD-dependent SIR2 family protein deacetylase